MAPKLKLRSSFAGLGKRSVLKAILNMEMPGLAITFASEKSESHENRDASNCLGKLPEVFKCR